jgi:hypothetical protein
MRRYAAKNAESWYKHVNAPEGRGRRLVNGFLYLITGCEKSQSWGMATFQNVAAEKEFQLLFKPQTDAAAGWKLMSLLVGNTVGGKAPLLAQSNS